MDCIDFFIIQKSKQISTINAYKKQIYNNFPVINLSFTENNIRFSILLEEIQKKKIICDLQLKFTQQTIQLKFYVDEKHDISKQNRQILQKQFLEMNTINNLNFKINPNSSGIFMSISLFFSNLKSKSQKIIYNLIEYLFDFKKQLVNKIQILFYLVYFKQTINSQNQNYYSQIQKQYSELKTFIKSSNFYSWNVLRGNTEKSRQKYLDFYSQSKKNFRNFRKSFKQNKKGKQFQKIYRRQIKQNLPFFPLTSSEDVQLKNKYLVKTRSVAKDSKQIEYINIQNIEMINLMQKKKYVVLQTKQKSIKVAITKVKDTQIFRVQYQRQIIKKLQAQQFIGIAKYYIIKNHADQTKNLIITNLTSSINLKRYQEVNQQTLSMNTKIYLLSQIVSIIKYLRDQQIVLNNLNIQNIKIKRGIVKMTNFSKAFHSQILYERVKQIYPKDLSIENIYNLGCEDIYNNEKSDVISFGGVMFLLLFKKNYIDIKDSQLKISKIREIMQKQIIINIEYYDNFGKYDGMLLLMLSLMMINIKELKEECKEWDYNLEKVPYLDWIIIVIKYINHKY